jgi:hypothetical protein
MKSELSKKDLYEAVKVLVEHDDKPHIHLTQHKLFTLFSIAFQYFLFCSTKKPGAYIIRVEDSLLVEKLARKSKDASTRRFIQSMLLPRKIKFNKSTFYLDFFHIGTWNMTNEIPQERVQGAVIIKNTSSKPMADAPPMAEEGEEEEIDKMPNMEDLPKDYYHSSLTSFAPKTITIAYECEFENTHQVEFPFIKRDREKTLGGVTISSDIDWDEVDTEKDR